MAIYDEDLEIVTVVRPRSSPLDATADQLFATRQVVQARWDKVAGDRYAPLRILSTSINLDRLSSISEEITWACDALGELLGCEPVGIRVTTLNGPMCPRFHVDQVPCRLLITISGQGTEWIPSDDVDWALLKGGAASTN